MRKFPYYDVFPESLRSILKKSEYNARKSELNSFYFLTQNLSSKWIDYLLPVYTVGHSYQIDKQRNQSLDAML